MYWVADQLGQHKCGRCRSNEFSQIGEKGTPWHFWENQSRLTGVPKKSLCQTNMTFAVTPLVLTPFVHNIECANVCNSNEQTYT